MNAVAEAPDPRACARQIAAAFAHYNDEFRAITQRAPQRFDARDWRGSQRGRGRAHRAVRSLRQPDDRRAAPGARRGGARAHAVARGAARIRRAGRGAAGRRVHQDVLQLHQPPAVRHRGGRAGHRVRGHRPRSARRHSFRRRHQHLPQPRLALAAVRGPARRRALPLAVARSRQERRARDGRGARAPDGPRRAARGGARRGHPRGVLPDLARLHRRQAGRPRTAAAAGDRAQEQRRRRAGGRGDAGRGRRQHRVQLHALLLPRRPRARGRGGAVPALDHAAQAGERAVHRARACAPGQDRALSRADA